MRGFWNLVLAAVLTACAACSTLRSPVPTSVSAEQPTCAQLETYADSWSRVLYGASIISGIIGASGAILTSQTEPAKLSIGRLPGGAVSTALALISGAAIAYGSYAYGRAQDASVMAADSLTSATDRNCVELYAGWLRNRYTNAPAPVKVPTSQ